MQANINTKDMAYLRARFIVPLIADDMIEDKETLDDTAEYAIHDIMSEFKPDAALLCIALCAASLAQTAEKNYMARLLLMEAEKMLTEYAPVWLENEGRNTKGTESQMSAYELKKLISHIPEDLETMAQLLEDFITIIGDDHAIPAILADILSLQASMHRDLALLELQQIQIQETGQGDPAYTQMNLDEDADQFTASTHEVNLFENTENGEEYLQTAPHVSPRQEHFLDYGDNVVLFPTNKAAQ